MQKSESVADLVATGLEGLRGAADRLKAWSPVAHSFIVALASALSVSLVLKLLDPVVRYAYWSAICWPIDGLLIGVMLCCRRRHWPWIMLGYVLAVIPDSLRYGVSAPMAAMDNICNILEMSLAALALPAFTGLSEWLRRPGLILRFSLFTVIGAPILPAILWAAFNVFYSHLKFWPVALRWVSGDVLTIALFTPLLFILISRETRLLFCPPKLFETLVIFGILIGANLIVFHQTAYPLAFTLFPILVIIASRLGFPGAVLAVNIVNALAATATLRGFGPFMLIQGLHEPRRILTLQVYITLAMVTSFGIALTALERDDFHEQLKLTLRQMEELATHDALTGLGNRRLFDLTLEAEWGRARREAKSIALLLIDADCFKSYNDTYGHIAGDDCLCAIAQSIRAVVKRGGDLAARYGGEEFVALLPGANLEQATMLAESIRQAVESMRIEHKGNASLCVTISIGCSAVVPDWDLPSQRLVMAADEALYSAKQGGRNRVVCAAPAPVMDVLTTAAMGYEP